MTTKLSSEFVWTRPVPVCLQSRMATYSWSQLPDIHATEFAKSQRIAPVCHLFSLFSFFSFIASSLNKFLLFLPSLVWFLPRFLFPHPSLLSLGSLVLCLSRPHPSACPKVVLLGVTHLIPKSANPSYIRNTSRSVNLLRFFYCPVALGADRLCPW